jgi:uncharacterized membrane protein YedE/YeeE
MLLSSITGLVAGVAMGYVLQRGQLCFHSMFAGAWAGSRSLVRAWVLAVGVASVGLSVLYLFPWSHGLNTGLPFAPVADVVGGVLVGLGMVVACSCVSGLFYKLGSGMLGALVGIAAWIGGEAAGRLVHLPGPTVLAGGERATVAGVLHVPRLSVSVVFLIVVVAALARWRHARVSSPRSRWQWSWPTLGVTLGLVTVAGWLHARIGHSPFGPSTVGATASVITGHPDWWLIAFLVGIVLGAALAARTTGAFHPRPETPVRYAGLAAGGFLLGAGGWIAGGCNLGHGLSGVAQMNVSSWVVVATMAATVGIVWTVIRRAGTRSAPVEGSAMARPVHR